MALAFAALEEPHGLPLFVFNMEAISTCELDDQVGRPCNLSKRGLAEKIFQNKQNSYATYKVRKVFFMKKFFMRKSIDARLLSENLNHKLNLIAGDDLLFYEGVVLLLWTTSYTTSLSK